MDILTQKIERFLGYGSGSGSGYGSGDGSGSGSGSGSGYGSGDGSGYGNGYGYGSGNGSGNGYGDGYGSGSGDGNGYGSGNGSGNGYGDGYGSGSGDGSGMMQFDGHKLYLIDRIPTAITAVHDNYAIGFTIQNNCEKVNCYIVNCNGFFAHGDTLKKAYNDALEKYNDKMPIDEKIRTFLDFCKGKDTIPAADLFRWHHTLTGSCEIGRKHFCEAHNINLETDSFTLEQFIKLTENSYGGDIIKRLKSQRP